jgi:regulator of replication initiation timing
MSRYTVGLLAFMMAFGLLLTGCQDTKAQQENEQLKTQVLDLQKQLGEMGNRVDEATKTRDDLMKQNAALREENLRLKGRRGRKKTPKSRRGHRRTSLKTRPSEIFREAHS